MLTGRHVCIAGAGGIGEAVARRALAAGAAVHLLDVDADRLAALGADLGVPHAAVDLTDGAATHAALAAARAAMGGLDGFVGVAGGSGRRLGDGPADTLSTEAVRGTLDLNALPPLLGLGGFVRAAGPQRPAGAVLIGSVLGGHPAPGFATHAYAFAKAGIKGLVRAAAAHYAADGIQVNAVTPGLTRTPMAARAQGDPDVVAFATRKQPLAPGGFVDPDEVASACVWLLSTRQVTGQVVAVDGGWSVS
ncbi:SDR family oxidoreductase [Propioniciclava coleopterorum]|uniref:SDR family oxidoreductase n=1 Tax=Propioniciclava coleopterorum TaxID=2714937 RepID=A0A6G7Y8Y0_9ACTN|nr:SDR family oxidoreductase [Propioniciclava coleopterorum]QIK73169.1 SDR family oxidoreductase [Propioniciclava coleopterorum]